MAKATPTDIAAGRAGGTVIVIKSSDLSIRSAVVVPRLMSCGRVAKKPTTPTAAIAATKINES